MRSCAVTGIGPAKHLTSLGIPVVADLPVGLNLSVRHTRALAGVTARTPAVGASGRLMLSYPLTLCASVRVRAQDHVMVFLTFACKTDDPLPSFKFHPRMLINVFKVRRPLG